jgi:crotonobetainyl-CoA:carnitine CoA-transferase CaiB-like acyl-CoA transferase
VCAIASSGTPLSGVTVVDLTRYLPGPYCTRLLTDLGATVIKIEPPQGDPMRGVRWAVEGAPSHAFTAGAGMYDWLNGGKTIVTLDLREPSARAELHALLAGAAVCVEGFKPSTAREIGVDGGTLAARYPDLVHCSISGYGQTGPRADRSAHDVNYQADAGLLHAAPRVPELLLADITAALHAAIAILAALVARRGATLDISLLDAARAWVPFVPPPVLRGDFACYNVYETADGGHVALGALESKFWDRFCRRVGQPEWIPLQFVPDPERTALKEAVRTLFRSRRLEEWMAELGPIDCCISAIAARSRQP